jgi:hypothetical protein
MGSQTATPDRVTAKLARKTSATRFKAKKSEKHHYVEQDI